MIEKSWTREEIGRMTPNDIFGVLLSENRDRSGSNGQGSESHPFPKGTPAAERLARIMAKKEEALTKAKSAAQADTSWEPE